MSGLAVTRRGEGPPLALVHGWGFSAAAFAPLAERLAATRTLHLVDLPGHGASRDVPMPGDLPELAARLDRALPEVTDWVGWSLGGLACLQLATAPGRVRRLGLLAATPRFTAAPGWPTALPPAELAAFAAALEADPAATLGRFAALAARGDARGREVLRALRQALDATPPPDSAALGTGLELLARGDLCATPPAAPSLWLLGAEDALVPAAVAAPLAAWPSARVEWLPGAGHAPFLSVPARCADLLEAFLDG